MAAVGTSASADLYPPDFSTVIGQIRALVPDVEQVDYSDTGIEEYMFSDAHLRGLYTIAIGDGSAKIYRAAASALRALAVSEGLIQKVIRTEDLQTDGAKLASALLAGAKQLEDQATAADEEVEIMSIVDFQPVPQDGFPYTLHGFPQGWMVGPGGRSFSNWLSNV
jgi:hypothetical protein